MVNATAKGRKVEQQARSLYEAAGYRAQAFYGRPYGESDGFNAFDFVALRLDAPPEFVQVKSNRAQGIRKTIEQLAGLFPHARAQARYLVRHDRVGWRLMALEDSSYETIVDERKYPGEHGDRVVEYLEGL